MEAYGLKEKLGDFQKEITYYSQMQLYTSNPYDKSYYEKLIQNSTNRLTEELTEILRRPSVSAAQEQETEEVNTNPEQMPEREYPIPEQNSQDGQAADKIFTLSELAAFNGSEGRPAYVAVRGTVYDVTNKAAWANGMHFAGLRAGKDLTLQFTSCHRGMENVLTQLPVVGTLLPEIGE